MLIMGTKDKWSVLPKPMFEEPTSGRGTHLGSSRHRLSDHSSIELSTLLFEIGFSVTSLWICNTPTRFYLSTTLAVILVSGGSVPTKTDQTLFFSRTRVQVSLS